MQLPKPTHQKYPTDDLFGIPDQKWVSVRMALHLAEDLEFYISPTGFKDKNQKVISRIIDQPSQTVVNGNDMQLTNYPILSIKYIKSKNPTMFNKHKPNQLDNTCYTINVKDRNTPSEMISDGKYARKLTNQELAVLQGFRKDFKFYGGKTSVRRQIGNALPAIISKRFFEMI